MFVDDVYVCVCGFCAKNIQTVVGGRLRGVIRETAMYYIMQHILASDCKDSFTVIIVVGLHGHTGGHFELIRFFRYFFPSVHVYIEIGMNVKMRNKQQKTAGR